MKRSLRRLAGAACVVVMLGGATPAPTRIAIVQRRGLIAVDRVEAPELRGGDALLTEFDLRFDDAAHSLGGVVVAPGRGTVSLGLYDAGRDDAFAGRAVFWIERRGQRGTVTRRCAGECTIPLLPEDGLARRFVLRGFDLRRVAGDTPIGRLAVRYDASARVLHVALQGGPPAAFDATIDYAFVPAADLAHHGTSSGRRTRADVALRLPGPPVPGLLVLAGFDLRFGEGDHPVRQLAIEAKGTTYTVTLDDDAGSTPFRAAVDYVVLPVRLAR